MRILDPMAGSGTTVVAARLHGHQAVGFDTDPLALLIAQTWCSSVNPEALRLHAKKVLNDARKRYRGLTQAEAYPQAADDETRAFIRFWFDQTARRQLAALSQAISRVDDSTNRRFLWSAFSRMIITKQAGASLAMDISHSRPHKTYRLAPLRPLERFLVAVDAVLRASPFSSGKVLPKAVVRKADARKLPLDDDSIDLVVTSPPYLNAIDYLRGHKFSLVWMGHSIEEIRHLRSQNIGTESSRLSSPNTDRTGLAIKKMGKTNRLPERSRRMLARYVNDMNIVMAEIHRVLARKGEAVLVVGDSTIQGIFVRNSRAIAYLGRANGLTLRSVRRRLLRENRRYLPPPEKRISGKLLRSRMREEVILTFGKNLEAGTKLGVHR